MSERKAKRSFFSRPFVWIGLPVIVLAVVFAFVRFRGPKVRTAAAARTDLEQHLVASGRVWVPSRVQVAAQTPGLVVAVGAIEGQRVKKGDLLVQINDAEARAAAGQAKATVDQAQARVEQLRKVGAIVTTEGLRQAETTLERSRADLDRAKTLAASGTIPETQLDDARRTFEIARAQKAVAEAQQISSTPLGADSRLALTALLQAQAQLEGANVRLEQTRIVAIHDGVVLSRSIEPGDVVQASRTLLVLAVDGSPELVFQPDERNLASIALGQRARASADAYPQDVFDAEVSYIAPSIDPQRGSVEVRLRVPRPPSFLKPDMTISVDLTVASAKQALTVPGEAVHGMTTPSPWVYVVEDAHVVRRDVKVGIRGEGALEIRSGIADGAEIVVTDPLGLKSGQRVRAERD